METEPGANLFKHMKHLAATALAVLLPMGMTAGYNSLLIRDKGSAEHLIDVSGLEISFSDGMLTATNPENTLTLMLEDVASMEFSENLATGAGMTTDLSGKGSISVWSLTGASMGVYESPRHAAASLNPGIYVIRYQDGLTAKISVK